MYPIFRLIFCFVLLCGHGFADHHLSFEDLLNPTNGSSSDTEIRIEEDTALEGLLARQAATVDRGSFIDKDREVIFLKLYPDTVKTYLIREKKESGNTTYRSWVERHVGDREGVMGYASDGEKRYRLYYDEEFVVDPSRDVAFLTSMVSGFMFQKSEFPFLSQKVEGKISSAKISDLITKEQGTWKITQDSPKVQAYVMISNLDGRLRPMIVSGKNVELVLGAWVKQSLETAFLQYLGFDHSPELFTTNDRWKQLLERLGWISTELSAIEVGMERALKNYLQDGDEEDGTFFQIESPWVGSDRYRFTKAFQEKLDSFSTFLNGDNPQMLVGRIFGEKEFRDALSRMLESLKKSKDWLKAGQWISEKPARKILTPMRTLLTGVESLKTLGEAKAASHKRILADHISENGAVILE